MSEGQPALQPFLSRSQALVTLVGAIVAAWGAWITIQLNEIHSKLDVTTAERNWTATIFDKYSDAVTRENLSTDQRVAALSGLITLTQLVDRETLRLQMAKMIRDQLDSYHQQLTQLSSEQTGAEKERTNALALRTGALADTAAAAVNTIVQSGATLPTDKVGGPSVRWGNMNFDIFWCQTGGPTDNAAQQAANALASLQGLDASATGRWRVRPLPADRNAAPGYNIRGFLIRTSADDEDNLAQQMVSLVRTRNLLDTASGALHIQRISYPTPSYISVFACPAPPDAAASGQ